MQWYYAAGTQRIGPVTGEQLADLVSRGVVTAATPVWRTGMTQWAPAGSIPGLVPPPAPEQPFISRVSRRVAELTDTETVDRAHVRGLFREVGRRHSPDETEAVFAVGLAATTPDLATVSTTLPAP